MSYSRSFGKFGLTGGYVYYRTKYTAETEELFFGLSYDAFCKPTLCVYHGITLFPEACINLALQPIIRYWESLSIRARRNTDDASHNPHGKLDETLVAEMNFKASF